MENTRNMKMTPVGLIPEDWDVATIKDYGHLLSDGINPQQYREKDFVEYSMPAYDDGQSPTKCKGADMNSNRTQVRGEVLLFNKLNVRQKRVWYIENAPSNALCSMEFLAFTSDRVDLRLLREILLQDSVTKGFESVSRGTSNSQKRIAPSDFLNFSFALPPLAEQHRIADALSGVDALIGAMDEAIAKKQQIKEGLMQQLLTGKVRLQGYTEDVKFLTIKKVFDSLKVAPFTREELNTVAGEYLNIHYGDILTKFHSVLNVNKDILPFVNDDAILKCDKCSTLHDGDIVFADTAEDEVVGKACEVQGIGPYTKVVAGLHTMAFRPKDGLFAPGYLGYYLNSNNYHSQLFPFMQGIKVLSINKNAISNTIIRCPSYEEQEAIVHVLQSIDEELIGLQIKHSKYTLIKQGMMQELLTGKTRLI